jgi:predicted component of type VI protein secretion system
MPLTQPTYASPSDQCTVMVQSVDAGFATGLTLTAAQVAAWSDQDLEDKVTALKTAMAAFLAPGQDIQVNVSWRRSASESVIHTAETVS